MTALPQLQVPRLPFVSVPVPASGRLTTASASGAPFVIVPTRPIVPILEPVPITDDPVDAVSSRLAGPSVPEPVLWRTLPDSARTVRCIEPPRSGGRRHPLVFFSYANDPDVAATSRVPVDARSSVVIPVEDRSRIPQNCVGVSPLAACGSSTGWRRLESGNIGCRSGLLVTHGHIKVATSDHASCEGRSHPMSRQLLAAEYSCPRRVSFDQSAASVYPNTEEVSCVLRPNVFNQDPTHPYTARAPLGVIRSAGNAQTSPRMVPSLPNVARTVSVPGRRSSCVPPSRTARRSVSESEITDENASPHCSCAPLRCRCDVPVARGNVQHRDFVPSPIIHTTCTGLAPVAKGQYSRRMTPSSCRPNGGRGATGLSNAGPGVTCAPRSEVSMLDVGDKNSASAIHFRAVANVLLPSGDGMAPEQWSNLLSNYRRRRFSESDTIGSSFESSAAAGDRCGTASSGVMAAFSRSSEKKTTETMEENRAVFAGEVCLAKTPSDSEHESSSDSSRVFNFSSPSVSNRDVHSGWNVNESSELHGVTPSFLSPISCSATTTSTLSPCSTHAASSLSERSTGIVFRTRDKEYHSPRSQATAPTGPYLDLTENCMSLQSTRNSVCSSDTSASQSTSTSTSPLPLPHSVLRGCRFSPSCISAGARPRSHLDVLFAEDQAKPSTCTVMLPPLPGTSTCAHNYSALRHSPVGEVRDFPMFSPNNRQQLGVSRSAPILSPIVSKRPTSSAISLPPLYPPPIHTSAIRTNLRAPALVFFPPTPSTVHRSSSMGVLLPDY